MQKQVEGAQGHFLFSSVFITQTSKKKLFFFLGTAAVAAAVLFSRHVLLDEYV